VNKAGYSLKRGAALKDRIITSHRKCLTSQDDLQLLIYFQDFSKDIHTKHAI